jgi:predicted nucleotidyltransferase
VLEVVSEREGVETVFRQLALVRKELLRRFLHAGFHGLRAKGDSVSLSNKDLFIKSPIAINQRWVSLSTRQPTHTYAFPSNV